MIGVVFIIATGIILPHAFSENITTTVKSNETEPLPYNGTQFDLKINDTFSQESGIFKIKLLNVTSDSRCPTNVYCIWQGKVTVSVGITQGNQYVGNFSLSTLSGHDQLVFEKYALHLVQVKPSALISKKIPASDYVITFVVSNAENMGNITITNIQVQPATIKVGDTFTINATLVNNSTNTITVKNGCGGPFSVLFDTHAKVEVKKVCNWMPIQIILPPGESIIGSNLPSNLAYRAMSSGAANATVAFLYVVDNKISPNLPSDDNFTSISKSFVYTVSNSSVGSIPTISSPLVQFKSGIAANDVKCQQGLQLVIKAENDNPACVKSDAAAKLVEWGWAKIIVTKASFDVRQ